MKEPLKNFFSFNKSERYGLVVLFVLILLLTGFKIWLNCRPANTNKEEERLAAEWKKIQKSTPPKSTSYSTKTHQLLHQETHQNPPVLFTFDPNTVDSFSLRKLGLREKTTSIFLHWRAKGKIFRKKEDLRSLYTLTEEEYDRLSPYIVIKQSAITTANRPETLNSADSISLIKIRGIGARLAHRIITYRNEHGPFTSYDQLFEVYNFPDSTFNRIKERFPLN